MRCFVFMLPHGTLRRNSLGNTSGPFTALKSVVVQYKGWHHMFRQEELLTGGGREGGTWLSWRIVSNRRQRASCNSTHTYLDGMHNCIFESLQPEGSNVRD